MEINVLDYLSQDEIKSICEQEVRTKIQRSLNDREIDTIIGNGAYYKVWNVVDEYVKSEYQQKVVDKVHQIIDELSSTNVVRYDYHTRKPCGVASIIMEDVVKQRTQDIIDKMNEIVDKKLNGTDTELYQEFTERLNDALWNGFNLKFEKTDNLK